MDIVGPLKREPNNKRFLLVATDYFTKWVKAKALASISAQVVRRFIWEDIICRFGLLHTIISNNGKQFDTEEVTVLCSTFGIRHKFSTPYHPQANGQVDVTDKTILVILKKQLEG